MHSTCLPKIGKKPSYPPAQAFEKNENSASIKTSFNLKKIIYSAASLREMRVGGKHVVWRGGPERWSGEVVRRGGLERWSGEVVGGKVVGCRW